MPTLQGASGCSGQLERGTHSGSWDSSQAKPRPRSAASQRRRRAVVAYASPLNSRPKRSSQRSQGAALPPTCSCSILRSSCAAQSRQVGGSVVLRAQAACGAVTSAEQELRVSEGLPHLIIAQQGLQRAVRRQDQARDLQVRAGAAVGEPVRMLVEQRLVPRLDRVPHQRVSALQRGVLPAHKVRVFGRRTCQRCTTTAR